jgi:hypothetical protein
MLRSEFVLAPRKWLIISAVLIIGISAAIYAYPSKSPSFAIGYISIGDPSAEMNEFHREVIRSLIDDFNQESDGFSLYLLEPPQESHHAPRNQEDALPEDKNKTGDTASLYKWYGDQEELLMVIDNSWGRHIAKSAETIDNHGTPIVTLNGDRPKYEFTSNSPLFLGDDSRTAELQVAYLAKAILPALKQRHLYFIGERDWALTTRFQQQFAAHDIDIPAEQSCLFSALEEDTRHINKQKPLECFGATLDSPPQLLNDFIREAFSIQSGSSTPPLFVVNAHRDEGLLVLNLLEASAESHSSQPVAVMTGKYVVGAAQKRQIVFNNLELFVQTDPMNSISNDIRQRILDAGNSVENRPEAVQPPTRSSPPNAAPLANAALFANRLRLVDALLRLAFSDSTPPDIGTAQKLLKESVRKVIATGRLEQGTTQAYFDEGRLYGRSNFELLTKGRNQFLPNQLSQEEQGIPNHIVRITDVEISRINASDGTFDAEFTMWVHTPCDLFSEPEQEKSASRTEPKNSTTPGPAAFATARPKPTAQRNATELFCNLSPQLFKTPVTAAALQIKSQPRENAHEESRIRHLNDELLGVFGKLADYFWIDNLAKAKESFNAHRILETDSTIMGQTVHNYAFRVQGSFKTDFDFRDYPFDEQELLISIRMMQTARTMNVTIDTKTQAFEREVFLNERAIRGWSANDYFFTVDNAIIKMPDYSNKDWPHLVEAFPTVNLRIPIERKILKPLILVVGPICLIGFTTIAILFLRNLSFSGAGEVAIVIFLSLITYSISLLDVLPVIESPTKAHFVFYATFTLVIGIFLRIVYIESGFKSEVAENWSNRKRFAAFVLLAYSLSIVLAGVW